MIPQAVEIPLPLGADTETVITALETAAVFRARGDRNEAMRWLRTAAASAADAGDDRRALWLSRVAAALREELEATAERETTREATAPHVAAQPSSRSARPPVATTRTSHPPPPSARAPRPAAGPRTSYPPRASSRPSYLSGPRPVSVQPGNTARPLATASGLNGNAAASAVLETQSLESSAAVEHVEHVEQHATAARVEPRHETPRPPPLPVAQLEPNRAAPESAAPAEPAPPSAPLASKGAISAAPRTGSRPAARVAVTISTTKVGVLEVRLLADGEAPRIGSNEAMLIMVDPASTLLCR